MSAPEVDILLVEDNEDEATLASLALGRLQPLRIMHRVKDGKEAIDYLFGSPKMPRVVLLDLKLPKLDGHEVLKALKEDERTKKLPVVMLTSSSQEADIARCYSLGANSYVVKPVAFERFETIMAMLGRYWAGHNTPAY